MTTRAIRTDISPYEEFVIENIVEGSSEQKELLDAIQQLIEERNTLRLQLAHHPGDQVAAERIHTINTRLEALWAEVRRVRAARRVQLEEALGINLSLVVN
jgi:hypothetical protein